MDQQMLTQQFDNMNPFDHVGMLKDLLLQFTKGKPRPSDSTLEGYALRAYTENGFHPRSTSLESTLQALQLKQHRKRRRLPDGDLEPVPLVWES